MIRGTGLGRIAVITSAAFVCALSVLASPLPALAAAPHVATSTTPDSCAMCHRAHTAAGDFGRIDPGSWEMTSTALGLAVALNSGDTALCYVCHGVDALGSGTPVGADFAEVSAHSLAPAASPYGPPVKYCSSCHDSHGTAESAPGVPYARLLRARTAVGTAVYRGSAYCGTCHQVRPASRFPGVSVYEKTLHYGSLPNPADGTQVRCLICHQGHGSAVAPLLTARVTPPSVVATLTVTANNRTFCLTCHENSYRSFPGKTAYSVSAHYVSNRTATIPGEWPAPATPRLIGECQVCHAPMGRDDGTGNPIQSLLEMKPSALCLDCHDGASAASTNLVSLQYPAASAPDLELVASFSAETTTAGSSTVALWSTEATTTVPRAVQGPRLYAPLGLAGVLAAGDIDGDGSQNLLVTDTASARLTVFEPDPLKGLSSYFLEPAGLAIGGIADYLVIADVIANGVPTRPEICVISGSTLYVYRYDMLGLLSLDTVAGLGANLTGMAAGDLDADGYAELVITDAAGSRIHVLTESAVTPGTLAPFIAPIAAKAGVRGPSIGDIDIAAGVEIAVANADEAVNHVTVYSAAGTEIGSATLPAVGTAKPWATLVADVLPGSTPVGTSGAELSVAANGADGQSQVYVFAQSTVSGLGAAQSWVTGTGFGTGSLAAGDIDGDTYAELVVGNGGYWSRTGALATPPSLQVFQHNVGQTSFASATLLAAGGVERAGTAPSLALADFGGVGPSRHPVAAVPDAHVAAEVAPFVRHVDCADCHNSHEATSTAGIAPAAYGLIRGTSGATAALAGVRPVNNEYELCYKCHSAYQNPAGLEGAADVSAQFDTANVSFHAVEAAATTAINVGTFVAPWTQASRLYCIDCHSIAGAAPAVAGPHTSAEAPILRLPYLGARPSNSDGLCYGCHKYSVYFTGADDTVAATGSGFRDAVAGPLHELHSETHGFGCATCHVSHGSPTRQRLIASGDITAYSHATHTCTSTCHPASKTYTP
ncbi:MAG: hypothetical protein EG823_06870 [Actinobacteria bacterium]|nr:hypothetical protein [Actinomycetota bacterium]